MKLTWDIFGIFSNNIKSFLLEFKLQNHKNPRQFLIIKQKLQNLPNVFLQLSWRADWTAQPFLHWSFSHSIFNSLHWAPISKESEKMQIQVVRFTRHDSLLNCHYPGFLYFISLVHNGQKSTQKANFYTAQPQSDLNNLLIGINSLKLASKVSKSSSLF